MLSAPTRVDAGLLPAHWAATRPDGLAWADGARRLSHAALEQRIARCAAGLVALGVEPGDVVTFALPDRLEFLLGFYACLRIGAIIQPIDPATIAAHPERLKASAFVVTDAGHLPACRAALGGGGGSTRLIVAGDAPAGEHVFDALLTAALMPAAPRPLDEVVLYVYTSGSTGEPKRVDFRRADLLTDAAHVAAAAGLGPDDPIASCSPLHHSFGIEFALLLAAWLGAPLGVHVTDGRPFAATAGAFAELCADLGARVVVAVPIQYELLARRAGSGFDTVRCALSSGSALRPEVFRAFRERFGVPIRSLYGSTEVGTVSCELTGDGFDPATVGPLLPGVEVRIVDGRGERAPSGVPGEIEIRSPVPVRRYSDGTSLALADGWTRTGDRGALDAAGRLVLDGRSARFLDVAGFKVDPRRVEAALAEVVGVDEAVVVSVSRPGGVTLEAAYRGAAEPAAIDAHVRPALAPFERPARIVRLDDFPRTAAGKVRRPQVAERLAAMTGPATPPRDPDALLGLVLEHAAAELGRTPPADEPLNDAGLDSAGLVALARRIGAALGRPVSPAALFDHPTPRALARWLSGAAPAAAAPRPPAADSEPIAIVAMACRLPGGVSTPDELWRLLDDGVDAVGPFPSDRGWPLDRLFDPDPAASGRSVVDRGGFIDAPGDFDPAPFGMSPREARSTDPQQRLLLELAWEAFERAGLDPLGQRGRAIGAYVGLWPNGWQRRVPSAREATDGHAFLGASSSVASGRIAYAFGLSGPALTIDTACSSSLVALHLACAALRDGTCEMALAGGATVFSEPDEFLWFSRMRMLAPDGRSKAFSADADGAGWAEGAGLVLLERLGDARRNGHPVLAVVRGSAINQDGRSQGLTAPSGAAQQAVIRRALADAGLGPDDIDAVEAQGTGTPLGDRIEVGALGAVFGGRRAGAPLRLGALKSNLGHSQAAAGIAGVIKLALALKHERLPRTLHASTPDPAVESAGVSLLTDGIDWPRGARPRRAGVSSFGISGTNAHAIVEEAPRDAADAVPTAPDEPLPLLLSGHDDAALRAQAGRWSAWLRARPGQSLRSVARTAATGRPALSHRGAVVAATPAEAAEALAALARGEGSSGVARDRGGVVFVFPGYGGEWSGMGRALLAESAVFAEAIAAADAALAPHVHWSLTAVLAGEPGAPPLDAASVVQPALFAMAYGIARVWMAAGVEPAAVVGHSLGEIAAAVVAGALSLDDGARLVALRSGLIARLAGTGAMASVALSVEAVEAQVAGRDDVSVAVVDGPDATAVAGDLDAIERLLDGWRAEGHFCRRIAIDYASHSAHVDPLLPALRAALADLRPRAGELPMVSTVTGEYIAGAALDADYWCRNLRAPVRLDRALATLVADDRRAFVEPSPHPTLVVPIGSAVEAEGGVAVGSLRRGAGGRAQMWRALAEAHCVGVDVPWGAYLPPAAVEPELPTFAFQRRRYWLDAPRVDVPTRAVAPNPPAVDGSGGWSARTAGLPAEARAAAALDLVRGAAAAVLGHETPAAIGVDTRFAALGLDSLLAVELRNRLRVAAGVELPPTVVFDHPTAAQLARVVAGQRGAEPRAPAASPLAAPTTLDDLRRPAAARPLRLRPWTVRAATLADLDALAALEREAYGWIGEDAIAPPALIADRIERLNGGAVPWFWVLEARGALAGWSVLQPTAVDPKRYASWAEATDDGRLGRTFDPAGRFVYMVAGGLGKGVAAVGDAIMTLHHLLLLRETGHEALFTCAAMPGFSAAHAATGVSPEAYLRRTDADGVPLDPFLALVTGSWPIAPALRLLEDGYPPDRDSGGHGVSMVWPLAELDAPIAALCDRIDRWMAAEAGDD